MLLLCYLHVSLQHHVKELSRDARTHHFHGVMLLILVGTLKALRVFTCQLPPICVWWEDIDCVTTVHSLAHHLQGQWFIHGDRRGRRSSSFDHSLRSSWKVQLRPWGSLGFVFTNSEFLCFPFAPLHCCITQRAS